MLSGSQVGTSSFDSDKDNSMAYISAEGTTSKRLGAKPVLVVWEDAAHQPGWMEGEEVEAQDTIVETVGWLVEKTEGYLLIVQSLTEGAHAQVLQIPAGMVKRTVLLGAA